MLRMLRCAPLVAALGLCGAVLGGAMQAEAPVATVPRLEGGMRPASEIEAAVRAALARTGVRSASVAVVRGADPVFVMAAGTRTGSGNASADPLTVFRAASLSKPVFAYLVLMLAAECRIDLDRPLHRYLARPLPDYPEYADLAGDTRYQTITARMALSHRTGFPNWRWQTDDGKLAVGFAPGQRFRYSGEGYRYLQFVVEQITGRPLDALAHERVFLPLGMTRTSYVWRDAYESNGAVDRVAIEKMFGKDFLGVPNAAGSMLTTASDYGRFLGAVLTGRGLPIHWRDQLFLPQTAITADRLFGPAAAASPATGRERSPFWCLGWGGFQGRAGTARFHVGYDSPEYENFAVLYVDRNLGVVVLTSGGRGPASASPEFVKALIGETDIPFRWMGY